VFQLKLNWFGFAGVLNVIPAPFKDNVLLSVPAGMPALHTRIVEIGPKATSVFAAVLLTKKAVLVGGVVHCPDHWDKAPL